MDTSFCRRNCWQFRLLKYIEPHEDCCNVLFALSRYLKNEIRRDALQNFIQLKTFEMWSVCFLPNRVCFLPNRVVLYDYYDLHKNLLDFVDIYRLYYAPTAPKHNTNCVCITEKVYNFFAMMGHYFKVTELTLKTLKNHGEYLHHTNGMIMADLMRLLEHKKLFHMYWLLKRLLLYRPSSLKSPESLLAQTARSIYHGGGRPLWQLRYMVNTTNMPLLLRRIVEQKWSDDRVLNEFLVHYTHQLNQFSTKFTPGRVLQNYNVCLAEIKFLMYDKFDDDLTSVALT
ncbi:unknown [Choristoneura fumiferana multiple nucleopolyhedrovirus]|uniref:Uncharacterized protein n=1 Tax=Choristoneura fumiferana nuclear polyhedrosis virus TaxID=208973 RepID=Q7TLQ8_NPVCF|nr:unknown [Choristoneura fumiferana multiple nucleopolyhedrovirus]AAP29872.1 unknown [Choristoneura fumiferana multiple nucleopolyhedrovirus]